MQFEFRSEGPIQGEAVAILELEDLAAAERRAKTLSELHGITITVKPVTYLPDPAGKPEGQ